MSPEVKKRCPASISGNCLQMTEGWGHCGEGECELESFKQHIANPRTWLQKLLKQ